MKRGFADTDSGQIYFYETGEGPTLILLHPSPQSGRVYWRLAPELAKQFRIVVPDTLGFGLSDPLPPGTTMPKLASYITQLMDMLKVEKTHLFGFHTGNKIAAALASNHPDRVDRLILCGQTHSLVPDHAARISAFGPITDRYFESKTAELNAESAALAHMQWATEAFADFSRLWWDNRAIDTFGYTPELRRYLSARIMDSLQAKESTTAIYSANFDFDFEAALRAVVAPTLIVEVTSAAEAHLGAQAAPLAALMQDGSHATVEDGDREVLEMRTSEIRDLVLEFLTRLEDGQHYFRE